MSKFKKIILPFLSFLHLSILYLEMSYTYIQKSHLLFLKDNHNNLICYNRSLKNKRFTCRFHTSFFFFWILLSIRVALFVFTVSACCYLLTSDYVEKLKLIIRRIKWLKSLSSISEYILVSFN